MLKYIILFSFLIPNLASCFSTPYEVTLTRQIMNNFSNQLKNENNLIMIGNGTSFPDQLKQFCLRYVSKKNVNINEARLLLVTISNKFLAQVNANKEIRPWMSQYPFTATNLDILIVFQDNTGKEVLPPNIAWVSVDEGKVYYETYDHEKNRFVNVLTETYDEAIKKVQNSS